MVDSRVRWTISDESEQSGQFRERLASIIAAKGGHVEHIF